MKPQRWFALPEKNANEIHDIHVEGNSHVEWYSPYRNNE